MRSLYKFTLFSRLKKKVAPIELNLHELILFHSAIVNDNLVHYREQLLFVILMLTNKYTQYNNNI